MHASRAEARSTNLALREHFVVAASAATNVADARRPAPSAGWIVRARLRSTRPTTRTSRSIRASSKESLGTPPKRSATSAMPWAMNAYTNAHFFFARWLLKVGRAPEALDHLKDNCEKVRCAGTARAPPAPRRCPRRGGGDTDPASGDAQPRFKRTLDRGCHAHVAILRRRLHRRTRRNPATRLASLRARIPRSPPSRPSIRRRVQQPRMVPRATRITPRSG
jgi:hypothetical protein